MIEILPLKTSYARRVAQLHIENLPTRFGGRAGHELLTLYYMTVASEMGGCGYVAADQNEVLGYICGIWDARELRNKLLLRHWFSMFLWGTIQAVGKPEMIFDILARFRSEDPVDDPSDGDQHCLYELRPIVVMPKMRRSGLGQQLVKRLIDDARSRGYDAICLYTEENNKIARRFYEKIDFKEVGRSVVKGKQYLLYKLDLAQDWDR